MWLLTTQSCNIINDLFSWTSSTLHLAAPRHIPLKNCIEIHRNKKQYLLVKTESSRHLRELQTWHMLYWRPKFSILKLFDDSILQPPWKRKKKKKDSRKWPVLMQWRSLKASVEPNAQQLPQEDWSRTWPIIAAHWGQAVLPSNEAGISAVDVRNVFFSVSGAMYLSDPGMIVPSSLVTSSVVAV